MLQYQERGCRGQPFQVILLYIARKPEQCAPLTALLVTRNAEEEKDDVRAILCVERARARDCKFTCDQ